jgi:hypothetical protein
VVCCLCGVAYLTVRGLSGTKNVKFFFFFFSRSRRCFKGAFRRMMSIFLCSATSKSRVRDLAVFLFSFFFSLLLPRVCFAPVSSACFLCETELLLYRICSHCFCVQARGPHSR